MDQIRQLLFEMFSKSLNLSLANILTTISMIIVWLILGYLFTRILKTISNKLFTNTKHKLDVNQQTATNLISSLLNFFIWIFVIIMILDELKINILPVLASAGILAFAIGFGAQELIKDLISGFFIIFEKSFSVGDIVTINNFTGKVTEIGIRKTKIKSWTNEIMLINNGDIRNIINFSVDDSLGVVELTFNNIIPINWFYSEEFSTLLNSFEGTNNLLEIPSVAGIIDNDRFGYRIRFIFKSKSYTQHPIERDLRNKIIEFIENKQLEQNL